MTVKLNHTIVAAHDHEQSALFLSSILGLESPVILGPFALVTVGDELTLDFMKAEEHITSQHYAFLVSESEFDHIFSRIKQRGLGYWADPYQRQRDQINHWDDGRGVYFEDPNGHLLEILTRPYGSGGVSVKNPHPLVAQRLKRDAGAGD
jgi:catechol 2,3-dioxygenase-like lactoylglutathione lyase family enzyme